jgi:DNA excision repair protein ERCC-4
MLYLSPTEHTLATLADSYIISSLCESNGVDIISKTRHGLIGFQRKTLPDLAASLKDGRLYRELGQIRSSRILAHACLLLEYTPGRRTLDGDLLDSSLSIVSLRSLLTKVQLNGLLVFDTRDPADTLQCVRDVSNYIAKGSSERLLRPGPPTDSWGYRGSTDWLIYLLQSFPSIGPTTAAAIIRHFGTAPLRWTCTAADLTAVPGVGQKTATRLIAALATASTPETE